MKFRLRARRSADGRLYSLLFRFVLSHIDPERAHAVATRTLGIALRLPGMRALARRLLAPRDERLVVRALGLEFSSPLGLAAGFDKDASSFQDVATLGFGCVEVGTITSLEQDGNTRPRVHRAVRDRAVINSMGFPNPGATTVAARLAHRNHQTVVGVNVGKTKRIPISEIEDDYRTSVEHLAPVADYLVINVSSPNTPGLRDMQAVDRLRGLVLAVRSTLAAMERRLPLLLKIGPDLSDAEIDAVVDLAVEMELDGIVAVNTTIDGANLGPSLEELGVHGPCGISGAPLKERAIAILRRLHARAGHRLVLVSVGGIATPEDAWERIRAGATLLQAHTGFVYGGPLWPYRMNRELARLAREAGLTSVQAAIGADAPAPIDLADATHDRPAAMWARDLAPLGGNPSMLR